MKKSKKMLACVLSVVTLGACISTIPTSADVILNDIDYIQYEDYSKYVLPDDFTVKNVFNDEDVTLVVNGKSFKLYEVRLGLKSTYGNLLAPPAPYYYENGQFYEDNLDEEDLRLFNCIFICDDGNYWTYVEYIDEEVAKNEPSHKHLTTIPVIGNESVTVGESSESSEETLQRGDINGDGNINVLDLLQLKKYILKIIDTLD